LIDEFKGMHYVDILRKVRLHTLGTTRLGGEFIDVFKILKEFEDMDKSIFFQSLKTEYKTTQRNYIKV
jgi:hypothetical protein